MIHASPRCQKQNWRRIHSTPLSRVPENNAAGDAVETVDVVVVAKEVEAKVPMQPCLGRHLK
jgi:hypothetical protein